MRAPLVIDDRITIPAGDIVWTATRSSGPGGQNVNKVASRVELRFDLPGTTALSEAAKARLRAIAGVVLDADGWVLLKRRLSDKKRHGDKKRARSVSGD